MSDSPLHPARPQAPNPATKPGQVPPPADPAAGAPSSGNAAQDGFPHSPQRDGDNAGGESTQSQRGSTDKGHQRGPRPGDHQGGH